jgi:hypothetical protein
MADTVLATSVDMISWCIPACARPSVAVILDARIKDGQLSGIEATKDVIQTVPKIIFIPDSIG